MLRITEIKLPIATSAEEGHTDAEIRAAAIKKLAINAADLISYSIFKRGTDARKSNAIMLVYSLDVVINGETKVLAKHSKDPHVKLAPDTNYKAVGSAPTDVKMRPIVIGFGPAGIFAALILAQAGFKPIVLERGKAVKERTKDTWDLWRKSTLNPESNVQFGEGGAGTFSDGKLWSQIKDPKHYGRKVLQEFVAAGAPAEILYISHPHIGTFRLVSMVENMRNKIIALGGEIRFNARVDDIEIKDNAVQGVVLANGEHIASNHVVLAVGHSARDTFKMVHEKDIYLEAKPFSIGFRIEHPQSLIDKARYGSSYSEDLITKLGAAEYKLVHHASNGRSVYSFCMCPGGTVVAATSEEGHVVTNGMSQYSRNERNANSGIVVGITPEVDFPGDSDTPSPLAGIELQRKLESHAFVLGGSNYAAPAQLIGDFLANKPSQQLGEVAPSYTPGVHLTNLESALPQFAIDAIREAIPAFAKQIKGYDMADGILTGVETRTSSPIRIKRDDESLQSINTKGLYPCGEGAGYAGGILSAGVDGIKVAEAVILNINNVEQVINK